MDRVMKKVALTMLLLSLAMMSRGSIVADLQNEDLSYVDVIHRSMASGQTAEYSVVQAIQLEPEEAAQIVSAAIMVAPGSSAEIIESAIVAGANPEPLLRVCLPLLPEGAIPGVIAAAINSSNEIMYERIILAAFQTIEVMGMDALALVTDGFLLSRGTGIEQPTDAEFILNMIGDVVGSHAFSPETDFTGEKSKENTESPVLLSPEPPSSSS